MPPTRVILSDTLEASFVRVPEYIVLSQKQSPVGAAGDFTKRPAGAEWSGGVAGSGARTVDWPFRFLLISLKNSLCSSEYIINLVQKATNS